MFVRANPRCAHWVRPPLLCKCSRPRSAASVFGRREAGSTLERGREPALRPKAAFDGDVGKGMACFVDQLLRSFDAPLLDECARRHASRHLEGTREMMKAQLGAPSKVGEVNRPLKISFNKELDAPQCRWRQSSAKVRRPRR